MQAEMAAAQDNKTSLNKEQEKSTTVNWIGKWCFQHKINFEQKSVVQNKYAYNDAINIFLQKIDDQRRKPLISCK